MTMTLTSCDECADVTCENGGTCEEGVCQCTDNFYGDACEVECVNGTYGSGSCLCDAGYEGDACTDESRADMIGTYTGAEVCGSGNDNYSSTVTEASDVDKILISNLYNTFSANVVATVDGNSFSIASQDPDNNGVTVSGSGSINDNASIMTITFTITANGGTDNCTSTFTKQ